MVEKWLIAEEAVFDDFGIAGAHLPGGKCCESVDVGEHENGLMEGADQVFAVRGVDASFAADGAIDLCEQCRWDLYEADATAEDGGSEAGEVAYDPAAECDDDVAALNAMTKELVGDICERGEVLGCFTWRHDNDAAHAVAECGLQCRQVVFGHGFVGDDCGACVAEALAEGRASAGYEVAADEDVVGALAERDVNGF